MRASSLLLLALLAILAFASAADDPKPQRPLCKASMDIDGAAAGKVFAAGTPTSSDFVSVAVEGHIVAAGYGGSVYIYWWTPGTPGSLALVQTLNVTDDAFSASGFGRSLSLENSILAVGHPSWIDPLTAPPLPHGRVIMYKTLSDDVNGFADFFQYGDPIVCTDTQDSFDGQSNFGAFVFQRNNTLVISSPQCCSGNRVGAAYTYHFNDTSSQWDTSRPGPFGELPLPTPAGLPINSGFGTAVSFGQQILLATLPNLPDATNSAIKGIGGIIYFNFDLNTGSVPPCNVPTCQAKLATWGAYPPDEFAECGAAMSELDTAGSTGNNRVSIGCPGQKNATGTVLIGSVFPPSFSISNRIQPPTPTLGEGFGTVLTQQYDTVAVGNAIGDKVYVYERVPIPRLADTYVNTQTLLPSSRTQFGASLAIDLNLLVVGSWGALDVYDCGNPISAAISSLPFLGLILLCAVTLL